MNDRVDWPGWEKGRRDGRRRRDEDNQGLGFFKTATEW